VVAAYLSGTQVVGQEQKVAGRSTEKEQNEAEAQQQVGAQLVAGERSEPRSSIARESAVVRPERLFVQQAGGAVVMLETDKNEQKTNIPDGGNVCGLR
jgi:hypothetical protein